MTEQAQATPESSNNVMLLLGAVIAVAGFVGFYTLSAQPIWARWLVVLVALVIGAVVASRSSVGQQVWEFVQGSRIELRKVVWPEVREARTVTIAVFVIVGVLGLFFWGLDMLLSVLTKWLTSRGA